MDEKKSIDPTVLVAILAVIALVGLFLGSLLVLRTGVVTTNTGEAATAPISTARCTDTDGGPNYFVAGTVRVYNSNTQMPNMNVLGLGTYSDSCLKDELNPLETSPNNKLREYYCTNNYGYMEVVTCSYGCNSGACIRPNCAPGDNCV